MPIPHDIQAEWGFIPDEAAGDCRRAGADAAEMHGGVVSFITISREKPAGGACLRLCRAEACQVDGADALADQVRAALGIDFHETTPDGRLTLSRSLSGALRLCALGARWARLVGRADLAKRSGWWRRRGMRIWVPLTPPRRPMGAG